MQNKLAEIVIRAERRAGEMLRDDGPKHGGDRKSESRSHDVTLIDLDIQPMQSHRWQKVDGKFFAIPHRRDAGRCFRGAYPRSPGQGRVDHCRRDVWQDQPHHGKTGGCMMQPPAAIATLSDLGVEVWLEKDALSGIFKDVLDPYGVTLNVGRGYDGWSSIHDAAERYGDGDEVTVLYYGDHDPSGENMFKSLRKRLADAEQTR